MAGLQGRTLGGYQLTEQIASAGIAEVYRGRPLAANGREVVIKVIYPEFARYPSFLPNFQQIIQTAARLASHPHILPIVASGEENGYLYLATPWVEHGTLRDLIARGGRLGMTDAGPFFHQLCSALAYAHSLSLVHGNLKPSNVFLYEGRHVMLGDFGMLWDIRQLDMNHSGSGVDVVEYLAPESFSGQFTQQSDIYSLGAILFAALTGRPPFSGSKPADLRDAHMQYPPPRLGQVDPSLPPGIQALDPVIQQAMAKRPEERFPSAMALAQAIDTTLKQQPPAPPPSAKPALLPSGRPQTDPAPQPGSPQQGAPGVWAAPGPISTGSAPPAPAGPAAGMGAPPNPGGASMRPLDPPFPLIKSEEQAKPSPTPGWPAQAEPAPASGWPAQAQANAPLEQGWPAQAAPPPASGWPGTEGIQYTERVPAPPVARPLLAPPQSRVPSNSPSIPEPDLWAAQYMPAIGDGQERTPDAQLADAFSEDRLPSEAPVRRQAARDDDWRLGGNGAAQMTRDNDWPFGEDKPAQAAFGRQGSANYASEYSEYTNEQPVPDDDDDYDSDYDSGFGTSSADWASLSQSSAHSQALRYRGGFSATELGLPRLTNPALQGELPPEWEDLLAGELLPSRADIRSGAAPRSARHNPPDDQGYGNAGAPYAPGRPPAKAGGQRVQPANDGRSYWQPAVGNPGAQRAQPMPTLASVHHAALPPNRGQAPSPSRAPSRVPPAERIEQDESEDYMPRKRRWPSVVLVVVLLLALVGSTGVVLAKPTLCPGTVCTQANHFLHTHLTFLGPPPNANVLHVTPSTLTVHAITGSSTNLNVQVSNSGTDPAKWHASADVAWLTITPSSGTLLPGATETLGVVASPVGMKPGNYSAHVRVETPDTAVSIPVTAAVAIGPKIQISSGTLDITQCGVPQPFKVSNTGDGPLTFTAKPSNATAITLSSASGSINPGESQTLSVTMSCPNALFGDYSISVTSNGGNGTVAIHYNI
ncbi:MAG TPA: protein kinase [Ktedonobacterales bacterium]|nr:protein kinase [Ktedonobacterales bacterium]